MFGLGRVVSDFMVDNNFEKNLSQAEQAKKTKIRKLLRLKSKLSDIWEEIDRLDVLKRTPQIENEIAELKKRAEPFGEKILELEYEFYNPSYGIYSGIAVKLLHDGNIDFAPFYYKWANLDNHKMNVGSTRVGKSYELGNSADQAVAAGHNVIVVDPKRGKKAELLAWLIESAIRHDRQEDLMILDPVFFQITDYCNPVFGLSNSQLTSMGVLLGLGATSQETPDSIFYEGVANKALLGVTTGMDYLEKVTDPTGNITRAKVKEETQRYYNEIAMRGKNIKVEDVENMILNPDLVDRLYGDYSGPSYEKRQDHLYNRTLITFKELAHYLEMENLKNLESTIAMLSPSPNIKYEGGSYEQMVALQNEALAIIRSTTRMDPAFYGKVTEGLRSTFMQLSSGPVGKLFCTTRINPIINRLFRKDKKMILYVHPAPLKFQKTSEAVIKVVIKMFEAIYGTLNSSARGLDDRTYCFVDEAKPMVFPGIEELLNKLGGAGFIMILYFQSLADAVARLGKNLSDVAYDNINNVVYMKTNNPASKKTMSDDLGVRKAMDMKMMMSVDASRFQIAGETENLVHASSIGKLKKGEAYITHLGESYFVLLPYQAAPKIELIMPDTAEEEMFKAIAGWEEEIDGSK